MLAWLSEGVAYLGKWVGASLVRLDASLGKMVVASLVRAIGSC